MSTTESARGGVWRAISTGLVAGLLAVIVFVGLAAIVVPAVSGSTPLTVMTSSMEPDLPPGTLIVVRPTPAEEIKPGDIVTYQLRSGEPTLVTHRVIEQTISADGEYLFTTQGDANPNPDPGPIREVQIRGTLWYALPWIGWVTQIVTGDVRAIVIPIVVVALFGYAAFMLISGIRERRRSRGTGDSSADLSSEPVTEPVAATAAEPATGVDAPKNLTRRELRESPKP